MKRPHTYNMLGVEPPKGFLVHGPPGCGKTLFAQVPSTDNHGKFCYHYCSLCWVFNMQFFLPSFFGDVIFLENFSGIYIILYSIVYSEQC